MLFLKVNMNDTLILFGRSLFINKVKSYIPNLIEKYDTLGINYFYKSYPNVKGIIFYDKNTVIDEKIDNLIITDKKNKDEVKHQKNVELYDVITNRYEFSKKQGVLNYYYFTSSMAINWAYLKGYKNVVFCGVDLFLINNFHFDDKNDLPKQDKKVLLKTKKYTEDVCQMFINLYQLNPESDLKIPKISIEKLLEREIKNG